MKHFSENLRQTFPDHWTFFTFITYIGLFVCQGIFMKASQTSDNTYDYSTIAAVLVTELVKLIASILWYFKDSSITNFAVDVKSNIKLLVLYFVPSALYCIYNNLIYLNLRNFDPATYNLLLQFRVVITGIIYQCVFRKRLTAWQWFSLTVLTTGCVIKNLGTHGTAKQTSETSHSMIVNLLLLLCQLTCSCFAGVANEYLLKKTGTSLKIEIHNIFMYIDSIICNIGALIFYDQVNNSLGSKYPTIESFISLFRPTVIIVVANNAACGIVTSIFLKKLNSILKTFASAIELILIAGLCWILFSIPIDIYTSLSIVFIIYAIYLQFKYPIKLNLAVDQHSSSAITKSSNFDRTHSSAANDEYFLLENFDDNNSDTDQKHKFNNQIV